MSLVHGVGGVFIQSMDPEALAGWYTQHLDMEFEEHPDGGSYYIVFRTRDLQNGEIRENPVFAIEPAAGDLAEPSSRGFTLGLRVGNLDETLQRLTESGVAVEERTLVWEGGKHGWMVDHDGNRVELYEEILLPPDSPYRGD
ncbi:MAG: VOC family protein [Acidimicrobiia bacterium]|nr:VOC family protein [Acidimicrobiia bacterium]